MVKGECEKNGHQGRPRLNVAVIVERRDRSLQHCDVEFANAPRATQRAAAVVHGDALQPGRKLMGVSQPWKLTPRGQEHLLDDVAGRALAHDGANHPIDPRSVFVYQLFEGPNVPIPSPRRLTQSIPPFTRRLRSRICSPRTAHDFADSTVASRFAATIETPIYYPVNTGG